MRIVSRDPATAETALPLQPVSEDGAIVPALGTSALPTPGNSPDAVSWIHCASCGDYVYIKRLRRSGGVCPACGHHHRLSAADRLAHLLDPGSIRVVPGWAHTDDVLGFRDTRDYRERLDEARERVGLDDAAVAVRGTIGGQEVVVVSLDFRFMGGSIGAGVGELVVAGAEHAVAHRLPLLLISSSGGARMQEGTTSLMQLAKTAQAISAVHESGMLCVNLNTDPTFGGATASFAMLGDVIVAEPGARIGFAGPNVIRQTIRDELPPGFQTAEKLLEQGLIDDVVPRDSLVSWITTLLRLHRTVAHPPLPTTKERAVVTAPGELPELDARTVLTLSRDVGRPTTLDYITSLLDEFIELHGDRQIADDPALIGGVGAFRGVPVVVLGHQKGTDTASRITHNFGMPQPSGYAKARRLLRHAEKFGMPVLTFVDTPGAYPGLEAEEFGQGYAIATAIMEMVRVAVPVVSVVTGEGGSGGALGISVADRLLMLENSYFSVISPEGASTILHGTPDKAVEIAEALGITSTRLLELGIVDAVVPEPEGGAGADPRCAIQSVGAALAWALDDVMGIDRDELMRQREQRYNDFGRLAE
ncbi:acetyl-CoA carboxylase carboxyltransferase subunit alpha [Saccharopolyspora sp. NPDC050389]|uniref:acetyl-CoA carboxylase carboxyltransferase subunit alpha n=1 Tax=Saccharopolyspora sp. NPDC050389 TaxID=3155516 RepID=UPI0033EADA97